MYIVIFSANPYLLARASMELQMETGLEFTDPEDMHPFRSEIAYEWLQILIPANDYPLMFMNHEGCANPTRYTLTSRNYNKIMETIINSI